MAKKNQSISYPDRLKNCRNNEFIVHREQENLKIVYPGFLSCCVSCVCSYFFVVLCLCSQVCQPCLFMCLNLKHSTGKLCCPIRMFCVSRRGVFLWVKLISHICREYWQIFHLKLVSFKFLSILFMFVHCELSLSIANFAQKQGT